MKHLMGQTQAPTRPSPYPSLVDPPRPSRINSNARINWPDQKNYKRRKNSTYKSISKIIRELDSFKVNT